LNWEPKSVNLAALAGELGLGLDSFIFVDDNPAECAEVQENCPEVLTIPLPPDPGGIARFLRHIWAFDRAEGTAEDRSRSELYERERERAQLQKKTARFEDFLAALRLEIQIEPMSPAQLPRVAQLTRRTNQMNFTTVRRSESDVQELLRGSAECLTVSVRDRFGDYGLVGVIIFAPGADALVVDTFLLSCRALGRGVEHRMLARLGEISVERGLPRVDIPFVSTARNTPAAALLAGVAAGCEERTASGSLFRCPAERLAALQYRPGAAPAAAPAPAPKPAAAAQRAEPDYVRVAAELSDPRTILARVSGRGRPAAAPPDGSEKPRTALEKQVAEMWSDALGVPAIGIHDDFFDLGGHSLLAVQLLARARQAFQVELSLSVVYGGRFTIAEMAKAVEVAQIEQAAGSEYEELVRELEGLSEEEVRALLAEEQQAGPEDRPR
jgi:FkbH-like protein